MKRVGRPVERPGVAQQWCGGGHGKAPYYPAAPARARQAMPPRPPAARPTAPAASSALPDDTRPASLWPESAAGGLDTAHAQEAISRFDPQPAPALQARAQRQQALRLAVCQPALALRLLLAVLAAAGLALLPVASGLRDWMLRVPVAACAVLAGTLLWLSLLCAARGWLPRRGPRVADALVLALGALAGMVGWGLTVALGVAPWGHWPALAALACGAALAAAAWAWLGWRAAAAMPADDGARLAELQSRIRPHFLFNALNTALALVPVDPARAEVVLEDLSQLFRVALAETGSAVSLDDEVDLAQRYLAIEQIRFGPRLRLLWELDPAASLARLPPLVLQPLVENAVRHGVEPSADGGTVRVRSRAARGMATLEVINSLPDQPGPPGTGVALANVRERLRLMHDLAGRLHTEVRGGEYIARIEVPL
jgi:two-component system sensor histidine kinase AlgZ